MSWLSTILRQGSENVSNRSYAEYEALRRAGVRTRPPRYFVLNDLPYSHIMHDFPLGLLRAEVLIGGEWFPVQETYPCLPKSYYQTLSPFWDSYKFRAPALTMELTSKHGHYCATCPQLDCAAFGESAWSARFELKVSMRSTLELRADKK